mmetsp:Transcript_29169/g.65823  ORF Transcript_29169/g.65823 Transcript_29169/m.65823 type:complete len:318 (+) Transcript_29169:71-1024(+)
MVMEQRSTRATVLAAVATLLLSGIAFVTSPGAPHGGAALGGGALRGSVSPLSGNRPTTGTLAIALPLAALGALAASMRRRHGKEAAGRVAAAAVLTTDTEGRLRFNTGSAPSNAPSAAPATSETWTGEIGATLPLVEPKDGMTRWDPLGFSTGVNAAKFDQYRAAELKHGRVAMMATVGLVAQHSFRLPYIVSSDGSMSLDLVPSGVGALSVAPAGSAFGILVLLAGILELGVLNDEGRQPGDFGDPFGWKKEISYTGFDEKLLKTYELEHGRLAMFGFIGTLAAEYTTGYDAVQQWEHAAEGGGKLFKYSLYWTTQ